MSEAVKKHRKSKAMYVKEAVEAGLASREELEAMTVPEIKELAISSYPGNDVDPKDTGANCDHEYFRQIRIVDPKGNYLVKVCKLCGHKERIV